MPSTYNRSTALRSAEHGLPVFKSEAQLLSRTGQEVGEGMAYVHLPRGLQTEQEGSGTVSLKSWAASDELPDSLLLPDGRRLRIRVSRDALSECSRNRILRFQARWPPRSTEC